MKQHKKIRGILSLVMALLMMASVLCCTTSAANNNSSALSQAISQGLANASKQTANVIRTSTARPSPETPLKYAYTIKVTVSDPYGRAIYNSWHDYKMDFYTSKAAKDAGESPIATVSFCTDKNGKAHSSYNYRDQENVSYIDTYITNPPASLYYSIRSVANTIFTPQEGTAYPILYVEN